MNSLKTATFLSSEVSSSPPFSLTRLPSTRVYRQQWSSNAGTSQPSNEEEISQSDPERSADFLKDIIKIIGHENTSLAFFFNFRKSREIILKDIIK